MLLGFVAHTMSLGHSVWGASNQADAPPTGLLLRQLGGAPALQLGSRPLGFWNGAVSVAMVRLCHHHHHVTH
jgi:hypothetical protein